MSDDDRREGWPGHIGLDPLPSFSEPTAPVDGQSIKSGTADGR
ncbi:hypothetical protein [Streptomyces sp. NBC_00687]|nr:hypothetical protein [Streptomyces sp. NBC_00687]MCX4912839.1 hypothetical protein [Streptomyces sp. NBC_00687]